MRLDDETIAFPMLDARQIKYLHELSTGGRAAINC